MNDTQDERREYFRIDDRIGLIYQEVPPERLGACAERLQKGLESQFTVASSLAAITHQLTGTLHKIEASDPDVAAYLKGLNRKIDLLGRVHMAQEGDLLNQPLRAVNLSATGLSFPIEETFPEGTVLELKFLLMPSFTGILCYAKVIACDPIEDEGYEERFQARTRFIHMRGQDKDLLIQHVLQRQGERIREARNGDGETP